MLASLRTAFTSHFAPQFPALETPGAAKAPAPTGLAKLRRHAARAILEALEPRTLLTAYVVNTLVDESNGINVGNVSLRDAINAANANPGPDSISFAPALTANGPATITLTNGEIDFTDTTGLTTITGPGATLLSISGNNANRIFSLSASASASISELTISHGNDATQGGAIQNLGALTLSNCTFSQNTAGSLGGAIYANQSNTSLINCSFSNNTTSGGTSKGGGIYQFAGTVDVTGSTFSGNSSANGGALYNVAGTLTVANSSFSADTASNFGGAIFNDTSLILSGSTFSGNSAVDGGGLASTNTATVTNSTFVANNASAYGGAIFNFGTINIADSTISGNHANNTSGGIDGFAGTLNNTIIAGNTGTIPDISGSVTSPAYNLIGVGDSLTGINNGVNGNMVGTAGSPINPLLGSLANNGGLVQTMALLPGSPAIDAGDPAFSAPPATDARGTNFARVANGHLDIGAFEAQKIHIVLSAPTSAIAGAPFTVSITALDEFNQPVGGYTGPLNITSSASSSLLPSGATLSSTTGTGTFSATINSAGTFSLEAKDPVTPSIDNSTNIAIIADAAPTALALAGSSVGEHLPIGTTIGSLSTTDPDAGDSFSYALVSGDGSTNNTYFAISGNSLITNAVFTYSAQHTFSIRVRTTDHAGLFTEQTFTITILPPVARLFFPQFPPNVVAGQTQSRTITVQVLNAIGTLNTTSKNSVTLKILNGPAKAKLTGKTVLTPANGQVAFGKFSFTIAGLYTLQATDSGFAAATTMFTVWAAPSVSLRFSKIPTTASVGVPFLVRVSAYDKYNNMNTRDTRLITLSLATHPNESLLHGTLKLHLIAGTIAFTGLSVNKAGKYTLKATDGLKLTLTSGNITVT
ncbi:MAG TPA: choice-of-anchor Q domain-containing protein [Phycisphaerae bacterium]|nr:choice-of-anchor Q domain-containing protein [Phycisphaerae bacterium]